MMHGADLPAWAALLTAFFVVVGSGLTLVGSLGLLRLKTFYQRLHAPTLGTTLGTGAILIGSMIFFSALGARLVLHEMLIAVFVTVTAPITFILLLRATQQRGADQGSLAKEKPRGASRSAGEDAGTETSAAPR
jgi:multicomponent K+:H+ antiporter subunit G